MTAGHDYDVVVAGGGAAGVAAACGAAATGARVLLVERYGFLGGAATNANVLAYCGFFTQGNTPHRAVAGIGGDLLDELAKLGLDVSAHRSSTGNWIVLLDGEAVKLAMDRLVARYGVSPLLHSRIVGAERDADGRVGAVTLVDHAGPRRVTAAAFVDASGEAGLAHLAGAATMIRDASERQAASLPVRFGGIPPGVKPDATRLQNAIATLVLEDARVRIRPAGGLLFRVPLSHDFWWLGLDLLTDGLTGRELSVAETAGRATAWAFLEALRREVPGFERAYIAQTGPQLGIRDSRQGVPRETITADDVISGRERSDAIARGAWPAEVHRGLGGVTYVSVGGRGIYGIPLGALQSLDAANLWFGGRVIGCDPVAYGSLRVMGTAFATGHAAGVAAALQAMAGRDDAVAGPVGVEGVRAMLQRQGALV